MKIYENKTLIFPFVSDNETDSEEDYCIVIEKGEFTIVDGQRLSIGELKNLAKALSEAVLRVQNLE